MLKVTIGLASILLLASCMMNKQYPANLSAFGAQTLSAQITSAGAPDYSTVFAKIISRIASNVIMLTSKMAGYGSTPMH